MQKLTAVADNAIPVVLHSTDNVISEMATAQMGEVLDRLKGDRKGLQPHEIKLLIQLMEAKGRQGMVADTNGVITHFAAEKLQRV